jgi:4-carboxymuconolactone decarboxylase
MRLPLLNPPYPPDVEHLFERMKRGTGREPLLLLRLFANHANLWGRILPISEFQLGPNSGLDLRTRELLINRTCARCRCEYEWGVHATVFAGKAELTPGALAATVNLASSDDTPLEISMVDELHDAGTISDALWQKLASRWSPAQILEMLVLIGWYHMISFVANAAGLPSEPWAERFPSQEQPSSIARD